MLFDNIPVIDLIMSIEAEAAKSMNEIKCARKDLEQADARLRFILSVVHNIKERYEE